VTEVWTTWEGQVINGVFPLRRLLSGSDQSAVFLTDYKTLDLPNAVLKLVPAIPAQAEAQLAHWIAAAALSHPHLIRLFEAGRCQLGGLPFLFAVMEYAEQTLSQILPRRALTPDEARELLPPTLSALAFLHGKNLVQGRLKPSNILVVDDQLKLASDTVHPAGESSATSARSSVYDPPEAEDGRFSPAGDMWDLGVTLIEALTQNPPAWPDLNVDTAAFTAALPSPFAQIVRQCLNRNPAGRPTVAGVEAQLKPAPSKPAVPAASSAPPTPSVPAAPAAPPAPSARPMPAAQPAPPNWRRFAPAIAVLLLAVAAGGIGLHRLSSRTSLERTASMPALQTSETPASALPGNSGSSPDQHAPPTDRSPSVLHEEIPDVPLHARDTIRGIIKIWVRVTVDGSGKVVDESVQNPGRNRYFVRLAADAAKKWKFEPADNQTSRKWLLQFEFTRRGAAAHTTNAKS
jgi:TonB family protein